MNQPSKEGRVTRGKMSSSPLLKDNDFERRGLAGSTGSDDDSNSSSEPAQEPARNPRRSKSVSFAANVNFDPELKPRSSEWKEMLWEAFFLLLLVALALLAPAGQAIAHVNDIILLYAGGRAVTFILYSPYSPLVKLLESRSRTCSRRWRRSPTSSSACHVMVAE